MGEAAPNNKAIQKGDNPMACGNPETAGRLLVRAKDACRLVGMSKAAWDRLNAAGKVPAPIRLGGGVFWRADELREWAAAGCPERRTWEARRRAG